MNNNSKGWRAVTGRLPVVHLAGTAYFLDERLGELRRTENPNQRILLRTWAGRSALRVVKWSSCRRCGLRLGFVGTSGAEPIRCHACGQEITPAAELSDEHLG